MSRQSGSSTPLRLGLPKGRMEQAVLTLLGDAGIRIRPGARGYRPDASLPDTEANILKPQRSEEHTSELQSRLHLVCRLLLEKKKTIFHSMNAPRVLETHWTHATSETT